MHIDTCRTCNHTWRPIFFFYTKCNGNRLGEWSVNSISISKPLVPYARYSNRTDSGAFTTSCAYTLFYIPRLSTDLDRVVTDVSRYFLYLAVRKQFNVRILGYVNHFWRPDTGSTIQGGERLVELEHMPPDCGFFFNQIYRMTWIADVQRRLHAGYAATHHHNIRQNIHFTRFKAVVMLNAVDGCGCQCFCFLCSFILVFRYPGNLFPHRSHLKKIRV